MHGTFKDAHGREYPYKITNRVIYDLNQLDKINFYSMKTPEEWSTGVMLKIAYRALKAGKTEEIVKLKSVEEFCDWADGVGLDNDEINASIIADFERYFLEVSRKKNEKVLANLNPEQRAGIEMIMEALTVSGPQEINKLLSLMKLESGSTNTTDSPPTNSLAT